MHNQISETDMNFTPFGVGVPISAVPVATQFSGKLTQNVTTANGQVVGVLQGGENGVHYIRPLDAASFAPAQQQQQPTQTVITLPITMPGAKPGDPQQTVQIQVVNPVPPITTMTAPVTSSSSPKYQISQIPIQTFGQGATVLTVAYNSNQEGIQIVDGQNIPDGMTVIAALQPADIQMLQQQGIASTEDSKKDIQMTPVSIIKTEEKEEPDTIEGTTVTTIPANYIQTTTSVQEYLQRIQAQGLTQFLKFNDIKREQITEDGVIETVQVVDQDGIHTEEYVMQETEEQLPEPEEVVEEDDKKKKKKYKKKPPKPKKPKPGQVHIATALDGTTLFCCPECHMAYPEKELLEQHLVGHKIERRFICDICGAGLKRKEHLERHKLGHNPERPYVCSVCTKGFKRKEHLNLHYVIHSGQKTEVCQECGKGFYRKDHLRKHARSHVTRRAKEQQAQAQAAEALAKQQALENSQHVTIQVKVPSSQTPIHIPVQIQVPQQQQQQQQLQVANADGEMSQLSAAEGPARAS
ncbi:zinc finger protein with KRAB and SCAN domains 7-like isoform X2 [Atheta coriaria]|uniref:zinc finger protein with KRAB and SCAN domains 7-like isoform X2 n=1 Tax=Dalotia coriaria TaxID=877792 RepID=UPI0031F3B82D